MKDFQCSQLLVSKQDHPSRGADLLLCCFQSLVNNLSMCASVSHLYTQTGNISLSKDTDMLKEGFVCMTACCIQWNIFCQWELPLTVSTIFWAQIRSCLWKKTLFLGNSWMLSTSCFVTPMQYYCFHTTVLFIIIYTYCLLSSSVWDMLFLLLFWDWDCERSEDILHLFVDP